MIPIYFLIVAFLGVNFSVAQTTQTESQETFVKQFIQAQQTNDIATIKSLFVKNPLITIPARGNNLQISKSEFLNLLKQAGSEQQTCNASFELMSITEGSFTAQVRFIYLTYAFQNHIKAEKQQGVWKITELQKTFLDTASPALVMQF